MNASSAVMFGTRFPSTVRSRTRCARSSRRYDHAWRRRIHHQRAARRGHVARPVENWRKRRSKGLRREASRIAIFTLAPRLFILARHQIEADAVASTSFSSQMVLSTGNHEALPTGQDAVTGEEDHRHVPGLTCCRDAVNAHFHSFTGQVLANADLEAGTLQLIRHRPHVVDGFLQRALAVSNFCIANDESIAAVRRLDATRDQRQKQTKENSGLVLTPIQAFHKQRLLWPGLLLQPIGFIKPHRTTVTRWFKSLETGATI